MKNDHRCPHCGDELLRIRRRFVDRMLSVFKRVHRYKCVNPLCDWEGNRAPAPRHRVDPRG